jgi:hypothetical protein
MKKRKRVIFLVIAKRNFLFEWLKLGLKMSWTRNLPADHAIHYVYGFGGHLSDKDEREDFHVVFPILDPDSQKINLSSVIQRTSEDWLVKSSGGWGEILPNTLSAMKYINEIYDYDFLIRTNLSTFWNIEKLNILLDGLGHGKIYAGNQAQNLSINYIEGDGIILSKSSVNAFLDNLKLFDGRTIDDVQFGVAASQLGLGATHIPRPWIFFPWQAMGRKKSEIKNSPFVRCKSLYQIGPLRFRLDPFTMIILMKRTYKAS